MGRVNRILTLVTYNCPHHVAYKGLTMTIRKTTLSTIFSGLLLASPCFSQDATHGSGLENLSIGKICFEAVFQPVEGSLWKELTLKDVKVEGKNSTSSVKEYTFDDTTVDPQTTTGTPSVHKACKEFTQADQLPKDLLMELRTMTVYLTGEANETFTANVDFDTASQPVDNISVTDDPLFVLTVREKQVGRDSRLIITATGKNNRGAQIRSEDNIALPLSPSK